MSIKLTEKQLELLINAIHNRIKEIEEVIRPLTEELADHEKFLQQHNHIPLTQKTIFEINQTFETLPWSKKIIQVLLESGEFMTANEIVADIVNRVPALAEESSTRSSVASILSRRSGKLFKKINDKYGLIDWRQPKD